MSERGEEGGEEAGVGRAFDLPIGAFIESFATGETSQGSNLGPLWGPWHM